MKPNQVFQGKYLKSDSDEIPEDGDVIATVRTLQMETLRGDNGDEDKPILYFDEFDKGMVLNKTNWGLITKALGSDDSDDWVGRQILLYSADVQFGAEMKRGIRVRSRAPKAQQPQQPQRPAQQPARRPAGGGSSRPVMTQEMADQQQEDDIPF